MDLLSLTYIDWVVGGGLLLFLVYKLGTWNHGHFTSRGVKGPKPIPFLGTMGKTALNLKSLAHHLEEIYKEFKDDPFVGFFQFNEPIMIVKDAELIKRITVKEFEHFTDHRQVITEGADPIFSQNLFSLRGERWRNMRATLSPAFTSSKMKNMFHLINECGEHLVDYLQEEIDKQQTGKPYTLDIKDLFSRLTNDVIASSAFGLQVDSLRDKHNKFYAMGKSVSNFSGYRFFVLMGFMFAPKLMEMLKLGFLNKKETKFFTDLVHHTISTREKEGIVRPDMIHLLMQARKGELKGDKDEVEELCNGASKTKKIDLSENDIAGQAMIFFIAGFDAASTLISFASMLLATNQEAQRKLQREVDEVLADGQTLTYENVQKMKYLDMVISETLRIFPPGFMIDRLCVKNFNIPATDKNPEFTIKKGEGIWIPVYAIHRDPKYFPDPEKFDPERFNDENKQNIQPYSYIPFGIGPRLCIGQRFALLEAKVGLAHLVSRVSLAPSKKTVLPLRLASKGFAMILEGGFSLEATLRKQVENK